MGKKEDGWKVLTAYRPPEEVQRAVRGRGPNWNVHKIEKAASFLNLDYYSIHITKKPRREGREMAAEEVFAAFKQHLLNPIRGSAGLVEFKLVDTATTIDRAGTLLLLRIKPHSIQPYTKLGYCKDIDWFKNEGFAKELEKLATMAASERYVDEACIVVAFSSPQALRVSTVRGDPPSFRSFFAFRAPDANTLPTPGEHPVAGNREFGYSLADDRGGMMIVYTMGADRLNGLPVLNDTIATWGYCSAEIFWRQLMNEFATWVTANGGAVQKREPDRQKKPWEDAFVANPDTPWVD